MATRPLAPEDLDVAPRPDRGVGAGAWAEWALLSAVPLGMFAVLAALLLGRYVTDRELRAGGRPAVAVVTARATRPDKQGRPMPYARLSWEAGGRRWRQWFYWPREAGTARVVYAPSWPGRAALPEDARRLDPSLPGYLLLLAFLGALLLSAPVALYRRRIAAAGRLLRRGRVAEGDVVSWTADAITVRYLVGDEARAGRWSSPPLLAARPVPPVGATEPVHWDQDAPAVAAPRWALRPALAPSRALAAALVDVALLAVFAWVCLRDLAP